MNNPTLARTLTGIGVIGVGVLALLGSLEIIDFSNAVAMWWPLALIFAGIITYVAGSKDVWWSGLLTISGAVFLTQSLNYTDFNVFALFWPAVIITFGISLIRQGKTRVITNTGDDNYFALMSGAEGRNTSKDYKGGKATAFMGGIDIDLRNAHLKKSATLEVFVVLGGVEVRVPRGWVVKSQAIILLGAIENKADDTTTADAPVLTIVGNVLMGGVEVKY